MGGESEEPEWLADYRTNEGMYAQTEAIFGRSGGVPATAELGIADGGPLSEILAVRDARSSGATRRRAMDAGRGLAGAFVAAGADPRDVAGFSAGLNREGNGVVVLGMSVASARRMQRWVEGLGRGQNPPTAGEHGQSA